MADLGTTQQNAVELLESAATERVIEGRFSAIKLDGTNVAMINLGEFSYGIEALGERVLVQVDKFRTKYECKDCEGLGRIISLCECESEGHAGKSAANPMRVCSKCQGDFKSSRVSAICETCKGRGATFFIPDSQRALPTTGIIISCGADVEAIRPELKLGVRVLYGAHAGSSVPIRGQLALRMMQAKEPWAVITSELNVEDVEEGLFAPED